MRRYAPLVALGVALAAAPSATADDLHGSERFLCSAMQATICTSDGECDNGPPWLWNIPQFVTIDMVAKTIATTAASGENRSTPFLSSGKDGDVIYLQGFEGKRAFSFVINQTTGWATIAVAREEVAVSVFAACTPKN